MQTETPTYDANKKARIAASEVSAKTSTNTKVTQYFYRPDLMRKTRQRVDPCLRAVCESRDSVQSDAGIHCIVPTLHDWEIHIWFTVTTHIRSVALLARRNKMRVCVTKLFSCSAPHSHPHVHTQGKHASFSRNAKDTLLSRPTNCAIILNHVNTPHYHTFLSFFYSQWSVSVFRSNTRRSMRRKKHSLTTTRSPPQRILYWGSSDMLALSSVM